MHCFKAITKHTCTAVETQKDVYFKTRQRTTAEVRMVLFLKTIENSSVKSCVSLGLFRFCFVGFVSLCFVGFVSLCFVGFVSLSFVVFR